MGLSPHGRRDEDLTHDGKCSPDLRGAPSTVEGQRRFLFPIIPKMAVTA